MSRLVQIPMGELNAFDLPSVCVVTGKTEGVTFKPVKFAWYPPWIAIFVLGLLPVAIILSLVMTRRVKGELPFTDEAWRKWRLGKVVFPVSIVAGIVAFIGMAMAAGSEADVLAAVLGLLSVGLPLAVGLTMVRGRGPAVQRITATHITLKLPSDQAGQTISRHLISGAVRPAAAPERQSA